MPYPESTRLLCAHFSQLISDYGKPTDNVRVAAITHGGYADHLATSKEFRALGAPGGNPILFGLDPPYQISERAIRDAIYDQQKYAWGLVRFEYLYPGIERAMQEINAECSGSSEPWCQRKIIVTLGLGRPGWAPERYFDSPADGVDDELPEVLLRQVKDAGIELHTFCTFYCERNHVWRYHFTPGRAYNISKACVKAPWAICTGYLASELLRELAAYTGGKAMKPWTP